MDNTQLINNISNKVDEIHRKIYENVTTTTEGSVDLSDTNTKIMSVKSVTNTIKTDTENLIESANEIISANATANENINSVITKVDTINEIAQNINTSNTNILQTESEVKTDTTDILEILTEMQNKVDSLQNNIEALNENDVTILNSLNAEEITLPFEEDPFKLDEEFTGYDSSITYNDYDSYECNIPFFVNKSQKNFYGVIYSASVYTDDDTFDLNLILNVDLTKDNQNVGIRLVGANCNENTTSEEYRLLLNSGNNILSQRLTGIPKLSEGNEIIISVTDDNATVNSFKIEIFGKNAKIINRPRKFKIYSKGEDCYISKFDNYNGYYLKLKNDTLNPADLNKQYTLHYENVFDYYLMRSRYRSYDVVFPIYDTSVRLDLDGILHSNYHDLLEITSTVARKSLLLDANEFYNSTGTPYFCRFFSTAIYSYNTKALTSAIHTSSKDESYTFNLALVRGSIADVFSIKNWYRDIKALTNYGIVATLKDGTNLLLTTFTETAASINLGHGYNVTAYYDKNSDDIINVYMKVGNNMIKKIVQINTTTNENDETEQTLEVLSEKVIGTYDFYYETNNDVYFVVKDNQLYMFKNA